VRWSPPEVTRSLNLRLRWPTARRLGQRLATASTLAHTSGPDTSPVVGAHDRRQISTPAAVRHGAVLVRGGWQNPPVSISAERSPAARIVTALLRDGNRILLCHRSPRRRWYPDVWDLPGGHVEPGELPGAALARELREELGIDIAAPTGPPMQEVRADTFAMQIWLIEAWAGSPANAAPDEHDAIAWFTEDALGELCLAHDSYLDVRHGFCRKTSLTRPSTRSHRHNRAPSRPNLGVTLRSDLIAQ
jgi:8-oxo-dGTP diphosphatase